MKIKALMPEPQVLAELGRRLAQLRKQRGYSQDQLAELAGVGVATLRRAESGQDAQMGTWIKLLTALEMTAALDALVPEHYQSPMSEVLGPRRRAAKRSGEGAIRWGDESS
jgi:transcriptional regulator with XRE-family HTH domain